jgi:hypothetical protein
MVGDRDLSRPDLSRVIWQDLPTSSIATSFAQRADGE